MTQEPLKHAQLPEGKQWWLGLKPGEPPEHVILTLLMDIPPDYFRKELDELLPLSGRLAEQLNTPDEYLAYKGEFRGHEIGLVYHGSGSFSISTALEELARLGVKTVLRVGTPGGSKSGCEWATWWWLPARSARSGCCSTTPRWNIPPSQIAAWWSA